VQFETPTVQTVSATLGKDSLRAAIISGLLGVALVLAFLIFYYRLIALVVVAGLSVSGLLMWSIVSWLSKTNGLALTLSGAAGIIVSIGVTVDSYVVFFEKLKDDVQAGRTLRNSASRGFESAWRTILIADTASLIGALVLWSLTVGSVRGFAFFLGLSTLSDMVVSYFFTRPTVLLLSRTRLFNNGKVLGVRGTQSTVEVA
jgi:preprotein translocase subunit SecD